MSHSVNATFLCVNLVVAFVEVLWFSASIGFSGRNQISGWRWSKLIRRKDRNTYTIRTGRQLTFHHHHHELLFLIMECFQNSLRMAEKRSTWASCARKRNDSLDPADDIWRAYFCVISNFLRGRADSWDWCFVSRRRYCRGFQDVFARNSVFLIGTSFFEENLTLSSIVKVFRVERSFYVTMHVCARHIPALRTWRHGWSSFIVVGTAVRHLLLPSADFFSMRVHCLCAGVLWGGNRGGWHPSLFWMKWSIMAVSIYD